MVSTPSIQPESQPRIPLPKLARRFLPPPGTGPRWWQFARWPVVLLFLLLGLLTIIGAIVLHVEGVISESWPTTSGQIKETTISESRKTERQNSSPRTRTIYTPQVRYEYTVEGQAYQSDRIALELTTYRTAGEAATVTDRYPAGAPVTVRYDPSRPERSVVEPGRDGSDTFWGLFVGVGAMGGGLLFLRFGHIRLLKFRRG